jgi:hypothetical protein
LIRLFLDWIDVYHESHFKVLREIFQHPGNTRHQIWARIPGEFPPDNSVEADLFRMLVADLSQRRIIRKPPASECARTVSEEGTPENSQ